MKEHTTKDMKEHIAKLGRDWRTGEFVSEEKQRTNPDRYELITVKAYDDHRLTMLRALVYEPEHEAGGVCWCGIKYRKNGKKTEIVHNEQRDAIIQFVKENFL